MLCPHLYSWQVTLTRHRQPDTVWCLFPEGRTLAGISRHRPRRSGYYKHFGWRSHFLEETALDSVQLDEEEKGKNIGLYLYCGKHTNINKHNHTIQHKHKQAADSWDWLWIIDVPDKKDTSVKAENYRLSNITSLIYADVRIESKTHCMKHMINGHCVQMNCCVEIIGSFFKEREGHWNYWQRIHNTGHSNLILVEYSVFVPVNSASYITALTSVHNFLCPDLMSKQLLMTHKASDSQYFQFPIGWLLGCNPTGLD